MASACGYSLSEKDLGILENQLDCLAAACTNAKGYAARLENKEMRALAENIARHHRQQYDALYTFLTGCQ